MKLTEIWLFSNGSLVMKEGADTVKTANPVSDYIQQCINADECDQNTQLITSNGIIPITKWFNLEDKTNG